MCFSVRSVPAVLFTLLSLNVAIFAQSAAQQANKTPPGTVSGRVTIKEKPAVGVAVGARKGGAGSGPFEPFSKATTDQDGFYRITNLAPGPYDVMPSAPAFVIASDNNARGQSVIVGEDENVEGINFSLVRGGVITGKVTDADGRPVIQQLVNIFRADAFEQQAQPQRPLFPTGNAQSDDRGIYRVYGLSAGRYKVAAGRSDEGFVPQFSPNRTSYRQVFHPDVTDHAKATIIEVSEGSEAKNVNLTLGRALQTFSASGRIINSENELPAPNIRFGLQRNVGQRSEFVSAGATSNALGDFVVEGLIPGSYRISLLPQQNTELRAEALIFEVTDQDVTGLTVKLMKGATLSGVVVFESEDKAAFEKLLQMQLRAFVMSPGERTGIGQSATSTISPDGSFRLGGLPGGTANIFLGTMMGAMQTKGFTISRVERDGIATPPRSVEVKEGENVTGLRVIVSYGTATLRGVVKFENGSLPEGGRIFVRLTKVGENFSNTIPQVDARGHFIIEGMPAGVYELTVGVAGKAPEPLKQVKREVVLQDGTVTDAAITIDMSAPPKP